MGPLRRLALALYNVVTSLIRIYRAPEAAPRLRLGLEYAAMRIRSAWYRWRGVAGPSRIRFLGRSMAIRRFETFVFLVEEIFVHQTYRFEALRPDPLILDVGSNVGLSVLYFKILYPRARIVAFEPNPRSFRLLRSNVESCGLREVRVENVAVWDSAGMVTLRSGASRAGGVEARVSDETAAASGSDEKGGPATGGASMTTPVPAVRLSDYVAELDRPVDLVKMDVEGAEARCLRELQESSCFGSIRELIVECHHNASPEPVLVRVLRVLESEELHYRIRVLDEGPGVDPASFQDVLVRARNPDGATTGEETR